jgi:hypothetical protein
MHKIKEAETILKMKLGGNSQGKLNEVQGGLSGSSPLIHSYQMILVTVSQEVGLHDWWPKAKPTGTFGLESTQIRWFS